MKKTILLLGCVLISTGFLLAQPDIFKKYGHKKEMLTLSKGKYQEIFKNDEVVQIGTVLLNTKTNKVIKLLQEDTTKTNYNAELSSRFLTVDPLAEKHPEISPYVFCNNNPVINVDPDGRDWYRHDESGSTFWREGNVNSVSIDNQTYRNIGETFSSYDNGVRINFNQNEIVSVTDVSPRFNLEGGEYIPKTFVTDDGTKVNVTFNYNSPTGGNGDKALSKDAVSLLITGVNEANNSGANITTVDVSTTTTGQHSSNSAHYVSNGARAFDVDAVNGVSVSNANSHDQVDAIQNGMKKNSNLRENYGPNIQEKQGKKHPVSGHDNHIHGSVN